MGKDGMLLRYEVPTEEEWATMHRCIELYLDYLLKEVQYATNNIDTLGEVGAFILPDTAEAAFHQHEEAIP